MHFSPSVGVPSGAPKREKLVRSAKNEDSTLTAALSCAGHSRALIAAGNVRRRHWLVLAQLI